MKRLIIVLLLSISAISLMNCSGAKTAVDAQARMSDAVTSLILRIDKIYTQLEDGKITWEQAEPRLDKITEQLARFNVHFEYSEGSYGGYYNGRRYGKRIVTKLNFTGQAQKLPSTTGFILRSNEEITKVWIVKDPTRGVDAEVCKLKNGFFKCKGQEASYNTGGGALMALYKYQTVHSGNAEDIWQTRKLKE